MSTAARFLRETFSFASSLADDVWHAQTDPKAYEWWYFDALSDDGNEAVVVIFFDNFIFSPRYNSPKHQQKIPAIAFFYYCKGKPVYRIIKEFTPEQFVASQSEPQVSLENCSVKFDSAPYGKGYLIEINTQFQTNKILDVKLEWLLIDSDFTKPKAVHQSSHNWNLVAPRADVTGHINLTDQQGKVFDSIHFRGSGYHDHNLDQRYLASTVENWQWGRAHFADATIVYYRFKEIEANEIVTKVFLVKDGELTEMNAEFSQQKPLRDIFGMKFYRKMYFSAENKISLEVEQNEVIDSSFFYLRFLSEMTLDLGDGKPRKTTGISETLYPKTLNYRWLSWLIDMRIAKNGKNSFLR